MYLNVSPIGDNFTGPNISHDTRIATTMRLLMLLTGRQRIDHIVTKKET